jgi:PIN domain
VGKARRVRPLTLDAGALIAIEMRDEALRETIRLALDAGYRVMVPAGVLAQVWRDGRRQVGLVRLLGLKGVHVAKVDERAAKASGELCGRTDTRDVVDASVVVCARGQPGAAVLTSDPSDIRHLDPALDVEAV